ncbi:protein ALP1-like [Acyrthosiphon pisum]|uniref:DDE Tnp4 domain-containing protein n=1 Tax=Acyrthosiphon pisum TaxID=7029 RepID=A0A8R2F8M2_ACYPI|nr:protein ALP1-like [Acyrthosiphon pisum]
MVHGHYHCLTSELQLTNSEQYQNFIRMSASTFEELVCLVGPKIKRFPSRPDIISVGEILTATLRYLASGESMMLITYGFRIGKATVSKLILQCCEVLWDTLNQKVLVVPDTFKWAQLAVDFERIWQVPNCIGSIDGKHIIHQAFANSGSEHYNYKGSHSFILLAMCDANYNFTLVDIGAAGRCSDGGVFSSSEMGKGFIHNDLNFPADKEIHENSGPIPYYALGDEAFPLLSNLMRPYPGRGKRKLPLKESIFNYRLSRGRRTIENTFGLMASKWRIFRKLIIAGHKTVNAITKAAVVLHNFVKLSENNAGVRYYSGTLDTKQSNQWEPQGALEPVHRLGTNTYTADAKAIRDKLKDYFSAEGATLFQYERLINL